MEEKKWYEVESSEDSTISRSEYDSLLVIAMHSSVYGDIEKTCSNIEGGN